jgi:predicted AAA+ superfamily ATPase
MGVLPVRRAFLLMRWHRQEKNRNVPHLRYNYSLAKLNGPNRSTDQFKITKFQQINTFHSIVEVGWLPLYPTKFHFCKILQKWNWIPYITYYCKNGISLINRLILPEAQNALAQFRALCITGPRQSGKTTLSKKLFSDRPYVNFENPTVQFDAEQNPELFLKKYTKGAVFDEVQRVPLIFRYLQEILDNSSKRGKFILTGSNNFLLQEQVSQSLAGRAGYLSLLPLSFAELQTANLSDNNINRHILTGGYPEIWNENLNANTWMGSYVQTYVQRDVRLLRNITNLATFNRFIYLCANYAGQILNRDELARKTGVDTKTILAWIGLLENSYIIFQLQPWYNNLNKRIIKSPKIYFYDTGLLCFLLGIKSETALKKHSAYGAIFENYIVSELMKNNYNAARNEGMYFFRDSAGNEIDLIIEREGELFAIEIKSALKVSDGMLRGLKYWQKLQAASQCILMHAGSTNEIITEKLSILPWTEIVNL